MEKTFEERKKEFFEEYSKLVKKTGVDYASYPAFVPDGSNGFRVIVHSVPLDMQGRNEDNVMVVENKK